MAIALVEAMKAVDGWRKQPHAVVVSANGVLSDLLAASLESYYEMHVAARVSSVAEGATACSQHAPDLLILNPELADGSWLAVVESLAAANASARAILLAAGPGFARLRRSANIPSQVHAIVDLSNGLPVLWSQITQLLEEVDRVPVGLRVERMLSCRELDVFRLIGSGMMNVAISERLGIRVQTVETHRKSIAKKLRATGVELVRIAVLYVFHSGFSTTSGEEDDDSRHPSPQGRVHRGLHGRRIRPDHLPGRGASHPAAQHPRDLGR
jgi:DNA-binding NarL/FixJ family response regulator